MVPSPAPASDVLCSRRPVLDTKPSVLKNEAGDGVFSSLSASRPVLWSCEDDATFCREREQVAAAAPASPSRISGGAGSRRRSRGYSIQYDEALVFEAEAAALAAARAAKAEEEIAAFSSAGSSFFLPMACVMRYAQLAEGQRSSATIRAHLRLCPGHCAARMDLALDLMIRAESLYGNVSTGGDELLDALHPAGGGWRAGLE